MKKLLFTPLIIVLFFVSCDKDKSSVLPDSILAGQKTGQGVYYVDLTPDIPISIIDWDQTDTSIIFDFNNDGKDDFIFERVISPHGYGGGGYDRVKISSLDQNEIIAISAPYPDTICQSCFPIAFDWVDTLSFSDPIHNNNHWTNDKTLVYYYCWDIQGCSFYDGYWPGITNNNEKFIGFKIVKNNLNYFGWIGMYRDIATNVFKITDYAVTQEYEE